jgi:hypothetical protein
VTGALPAAAPDPRQFKVDIFAKVGAALSTAALARAAAKNFAETKKVSENITKVGGVEALPTSHAAQASVAVAVIRGALIYIRQHGIGFTAFFKFFFRVRVIGIAVGMELQRQFAVGALDLLIGGAAGYAQHLIIVAFYVAGQNGLSLILSVILSSS